MKTLKQLIQDLKFNYVNSNITKENFPTKPIRGADFKLFNFGKLVSSKEVIEMIEREGYKVANIYELLTWAKEWNGKDLVVALGQKSRDGDVPYLGHWIDRNFNLNDFDGGWDVNYRFLGVRESKLGVLKPRTSSDSLSLEPLERIALALERLADKFAPKKIKKGKRTPNNK